MQRGARPAGALLVLLVLAATSLGQPILEDEPVAGPDAPEAPGLERFEVDPPEQPVQTGQSIPVRAVLDPGNASGLARLHVRAAGPPGVDELEPAPVPVGGEPALLVTFWEPDEPGRYVVTGHVHVGGHELVLPIREGRVWSADALDGQPVDGSTWSIGIAPGTVLWSLVFMGLAYASQRWMLDERDAD